MPPRAIVLLNASAGGYSRALPGALRDHFDRAGWDVDLHVDDSGAGLADRAAEAVSAGYGAIIAGGGDGTLNTVASRVLGSSAVMGVLPIGTRNHFAKALGLPLGWREAVALIASESVRHVDLGEVNGRTFLNNAAVGLYPRFVEERGDCPHGGPRGFVRRWMALGRAIARQPALPIRLDVEGQRYDGPARLVVVGNDPYTFGGLRLARRRGVEAGVLGFYVVGGEDRWALARAVLEAERGETGGAIAVWTGRAGTLELEGDTQVALDGETFSIAAPLAFRSLPGALPVYGLQAGATRV